jgi:predicted RNase H-like nuclease (RuvC/YqgF family)
MNKVTHLQHEKSNLEDRYKEEKRAHDITRSKFSTMCENAQKEEQFLAARIESKNSEIQSLENTVRSFKKMLDEREEEIYRMKLHIGSITDTGAGNFTEIKSKAERNHKNSPMEQ